MKKNVLGCVIIMIAVFVIVGFVSCGSDDEKGGYGASKNEVIKQLMTSKWYCSTTEYNETSYGGYAYTQQWTVYFYNENEGIMHCKTIDKDTDLGTSRQESDSYFSYNVSSDGTKITLSEGSNFEFVFYGDYLLEGEDLFQKQSLSASDYDYLKRFFGNGNISNIPDVSGTINGHEYVDLGLSVKWAVCNIGANSPEDYGDYYAWGETTTKDEYSYDNYSFYYKEKSKIPVPGRIPYLMDNISETRYDVAYSRWGSSWRMPTSAEYGELINHARKNKAKWITYKGTNGLLITARNGKSIFFPAAGEKEDKNLVEVGKYGVYWTSNGSKQSTTTGHYPYADCFAFDENNIDKWGPHYRPSGISVRAVSK